MRTEREESKKQKGNWQAAYLSSRLISSYVFLKFYLFDREQGRGGAEEEEEGQILC